MGCWKDDKPVSMSKKLHNFRDLMFNLRKMKHILMNMVHILASWVFVYGRCMLIGESSPALYCVLLGIYPNLIRSCEMKKIEKICLKITITWYKIYVVRQCFFVYRVVAISPCEEKLQWPLQYSFSIQQTLIWSDKISQTMAAKTGPKFSHGLIKFFKKSHLQ